MNLYRKYFDIEEMTRLAEGKPNWGVNVLNVGHNIHPTNKNYPDNAHPNPYFFNWERGRVINEYQIIYIAKGSGVFETEGIGKVIVEPGTVFLLFPNIWHRYKPLYDKGWEEYWVGFSGHYADYIVSQDCFDRNAPLIHVGFNSEFINIFIRLIDTLKFEGIAFSQLACCLTVQLLGLVYASALLKKRSYNRKDLLINNIRYKIHENWANLGPMEELAAQHNISYVWFRKAFKDVTGVSPGQYHLNLKLEKACQLLNETELTISEIAYLTGFVSEFHFSKMFKKKVNCSPSVYRESQRKYKLLVVK